MNFRNFIYKEKMENKKILLTGATGYVGGRLLKQLEDKGYAVRALARFPSYLQNKVGPNTEVLASNILEDTDLVTKMRGCEVAYYLIHSLGAGEDFREKDKSAALKFGQAASQAGIKRIIYLGGLARRGDQLSPHLISRHETGAVLRQEAEGVEVIEFLASVVIGTGSLSYEMIRSLTEKLPLMIGPKWVNTPLQPIAISDLLKYLVAAIDLPVKASLTIEIGGKDVTTYRILMEDYAKARGLRRYILSVPVLTPYLSSLWLALVTPLYAKVGRRLIDSATIPTVVESDLAKQLFPDIHPMDTEEAIAVTLEEERKEMITTRWCDTYLEEDTKEKVGSFGQALLDCRSIEVPVTPEEAFKPIEEIGGTRGWYSMGFLWTFRGYLDLLFGGVGMRRGRKNPEKLEVGDPLDFWRVEEIKVPETLTLRAEMKVPGRAYLKFEVSPTNAGSKIVQTAVFQPKGLFGRIYWWFFWPFHQIIFKQMLRQIAHFAIQNSEGKAP